MLKPVKRIHNLSFDPLEDLLILKYEKPECVHIYNYVEILYQFQSMEAKDGVCKKKLLPAIISFGQQFLFPIMNFNKDLALLFYLI